MSTTEGTKLLDNVVSQLANATSTLLTKGVPDVTNSPTISTTETPVMSTPKITVTTVTPITTSSLETSTAAIVNTTSTTPILSTSTIASNATTIIPEGIGSPAMVFISIIIFIVAVALIVKIILSNRKKRTELIGSARWRISASQQSGTGPTRTAASYVPMNNRGRTGAGGFDSTGPGAVVDWERQFFDDSEPTTAPSRLQLHRTDEY